MKTTLRCNIVLTLLLTLTGCGYIRHAVITHTTTGLGFSVAENPASGLYEAKFGYVRDEFAYVPSNRAGDKGETNFKAGAKDVADVIMEVRYDNILRGGGLYQRLAVGSTAVSQPGASLMFAKDSKGTLDPATAQALTRAVQTVPVANSAVIELKVPLANAYQQSVDKGIWDAAAQVKNYPSFAAWLSDPKTTLDQVATMATALRQARLIP